MKLPLRAVRSSGWPTHLYDADGQYVATFARDADAAELVRLASAGSSVYRQGDAYEIDAALDRRLNDLAARAAAGPDDEPVRPADACTDSPTD